MNRRNIYVCTYNVMLMVPRAVKGWAQRERAKRIPEALARILGHVDVFVFTELAEGAYRRFIGEKMFANGYTYKSSSLPLDMYNPMYYGLKITDNGVFICSRLRIVAKRHVAFGRACAGSDCLMHKGGVLATLEIQDVAEGSDAAPLKAHILGVHLQAWDSKHDFSVRERQMQVCLDFIHKQKIPEDETIILAGDLNMDYFKHQDAVDNARRRLGIQFLVPPVYARERFSWTPRASSLAGMDSISTYVSPDFQHGCSALYAATGKCECCPNQLVDYIGIVEWTSRAIRGQSCQIYANCKSREPFQHPVAAKLDTTDLSDHLPVVAQFECRFAVRKDPSARASPNKVAKKDVLGREKHAQELVPSASAPSIQLDSSWYNKMYFGWMQAKSQYTQVYNMAPTWAYEKIRDTFSNAGNSPN